jgi:hypothetical protein
MIRVGLPFHLRTQAHVGNEVTFEVEGFGDATLGAGMFEARQPVLRGPSATTVLNCAAPFVRFLTAQKTSPRPEKT